MLRDSPQPSGTRHTHPLLLLPQSRQIHQPEYHEEVEALIEDLGLEFMGAEKMEQEEIFD